MKNLFNLALLNSRCLPLISLLLAPINSSYAETVLVHKFFGNTQKLSRATIRKISDKVGSDLSLIPVTKEAALVVDSIQSGDWNITYQCEAEFYINSTYISGGGDPLNQTFVYELKSCKQI
jgi:hypothetical protein